MERIEQPKTAVPLEVQRVLDAMTEENFLQCRGYFQDWDGKACFYGRASRVRGVCHYSVSHEPDLRDLAKRIRAAYGTNQEPVLWLNDTASSLSDFKSKIIALYQEGE